MKKNNLLLTQMLSLSFFLAASFTSAWADNVQNNAHKKAQDNYKQYCWQCHGMNTDGMGLNVQDMSVQPRDHSSAKAMGGRSDTDLFKVIKEGGLSIDKSVLMPPWKDSLSDDEIHALVKYLRKLCQCG